MGSELIKLSCPSCGGKLEVPRDSFQFICQYCGSQYALSRYAGALEIKPVLEQLKGIRAGVTESAEHTSRVALELELARLERRLPGLTAEYASCKEELDRRIKDSWVAAIMIGILVSPIACCATEHWQWGLAPFIGLMVLAVAWQSFFIRPPMESRIGQTGFQILQTEARIAEIRSDLDGIPR